MTALRDQTHRLIRELDALKDYYLTHTAPENRSDKAFFQNVKEKSMPIFQALEEWEEAALLIVKQRKADIHPQQIVDTKENMEMILMHSYYVDIKRKQYMEMNQSIHYVFNQLLDELERS